VEALWKRVICRVARGGPSIDRGSKLHRQGELDRAFREMPYSFGRCYVGEAIAATDPTFPEGLAVDCLWD
jgi:hypothetical protein